MLMHILPLIENCSLVGGISGPWALRMRVRRPVKSGRPVDGGSGVNLVPL